MTPKSPMFRIAATGLSAAIVLGGLSACAPLLVGGAFFGSIKVATDRRTAETQLVDEAIELRAFNRLRESLKDYGRVTVVSYGRRVLLLGEVPTAETKAVAERAVASVDNVQKVINELKVMPVVPLNQRSEDVVITSRIRSVILNSKDLVSNAFNITTNVSVVYVMGVVTQREADRVIDIARTSPGVKQVVNLLDLITDADLARIQPGGRGPAAVVVDAPSAVQPPPGAVPAPVSNMAPSQAM